MEKKRNILEGKLPPPVGGGDVAGFSQKSHCVDAAMRKNGMAVLVGKLRTWGVRGVVDFFVRKVHVFMLRRRLERNLRRHPFLDPKPGVTVIGDFYAKQSTGKTMRDFVMSLKEAGIPYQTFSTARGRGMAFEELDGTLTPESDFQIGRYTHIVDIFHSPVPASLLARTSRIAFWEFTSGVRQAFTHLAEAGAVIAMSDFNRDYFRTEFPPNADIRKILYPLRIEKRCPHGVSETRKRLNLADDDFVVFFNFAYGSSFFRKNPDGAMRAFAKAFCGDPGAKLLFKTNQKDQFPSRHQMLCDLAAELGIADRFITVDEYMPLREIFSLTNACDVYLSLHRGEGFGLGIAEAMSLGKPVVVTDYSATTEFCRSGNSLPVPFVMKPAKGGELDHPAYYHVAEYADPDVDAAAEALLRCRRDAELRARIGENARKFIGEYFSIDNFRKSVQEFLKRETTAK